jgi:hypothetical protein
MSCQRLQQPYALLDDVLLLLSQFALVQLLEQVVSPAVCKARIWWAWINIAAPSSAMGPTCACQ